MSKTLSKNTCIHVIKRHYDRGLYMGIICVICLTESIETIYSLYIYTKGTLFAYNIKDNKRTDDSHQSLLQMPHHSAFLENNFPRHMSYCELDYVTPYIRCICSHNNTRISEKAQ